MIFSIFSSLRFPFYFELKIAFVIWLLSPYTKGSSVLYRKFVHPTLSNKEKVGPGSSCSALSRGSPSCLPLLFWLFHPQEIDEYIAQAKDRSYETMMRFGKRGLNLAANAAVTAASKVSRFRGFWRLYRLGGHKVGIHEIRARALNDTRGRVAFTADSNVFSGTFRVRACCRTSCGVSACRT